ncbi:MAG: hypothetical protein NZ926_00990 [Candidatus Methanomethylicia archaeon]|nr:hypothetical protein [Candidatus Methanomethylicia archaeon]MDW7988738.1 hypothetical protein [Nitrososphaerota archaeon]
MVVFHVLLLRIANDYFLASSLGKWTECNKDKVGTALEIDYVKYTCAIENGNYR